MNFQTTLTALRSGWQFIAVGILVAVAVALALHSTAEPMYEASASYVVSPGAGADAGDVTEGVKTLDSSRSRAIMTTLTEITMSDTVLEEAFADLGLEEPAESEYTVESVVIPEANVIETTVTGPDASTAAALAASVGEIGALRFIALYQIYDVVVLDPASTPTEPSNPGLAVLLVLTTAIGLVAGIAAALLRYAAGGGGRRTVHNRLSAYDKSVTPIEEHSRFKRVG